MPGPMKIHVVTEAAWSFSSTEVDELHCAAWGWSIRGLQLEKGAFTGSLTQCIVDGGLFTWAHFDRRLLETGTGPTGAYVFGVPHMKRDATLYQGHLLPDNHMLVARPGEEIELLCPHDWDVSLPAIGEDVLRAAAEPLGLSASIDRIQQAETLSVGCVELDVLVAYLAQLRSTIQRSPELLSRIAVRHVIGGDLVRMLLNAANASQVSNTRITCRLRDSAIARVRAFLRETATVPLTVTELCEVASVSERTLRYAMTERFQVTPKQFLEHLRMQAVRRELLRGRGERHVRVVDIATRFGFWHMGQFAADYRRHFDELPSETIGSQRAVVSRRVGETPYSALGRPLDEDRAGRW